MIFLSVVINLVTTVNIFLDDKLGNSGGNSEGNSESIYDNSANDQNLGNEHTYELSDNPYNYSTTADGTLITSESLVYEYNFVDLNIGDTKIKTFSPCTAFVVHSNFKKVSLSFSSTDNIQSIMIADEQIDDCSLLSLSCPSNSKFCTSKY